VSRVVHALFLLSGAAGLIYQVVWVRSFTLVFGGSVGSASVVTATFLAGLGLGGWLAGAWADRNPDHTLRAWGVVELVVGVLGLGVMAVMPRLLPVSAALGAYVPTEAGWAVLSTATGLGRLVAAMALLLPSAVAMGATLPLLVRHQTRRAAAAGRQVGWLYGMNTLGAALGALITDTALVPGLGLQGTQLLAVAVNVGVGLVALGLAGWRTRGTDTSHRPVQEARPVAPAAPSLVAALFLAGASAMGLELVWFRFLAGALGPYRAVFSLLLATVLAAQGVGALLAGQGKRWGPPRRWFGWAQGLVVATTIAALLGYDPYTLLERQHGIAEAYEAGGPWLRAALVHKVNGITIVWLVALPAVAMGAAFPLANAIGQDRDDEVGRRVGGLYLATTAGNVVGALATGLLLLPGPGLQASVLVLSAMALGAGALVVRDGGGVAGWAPGVVAAVVLAWQPGDTLLWSTFPHGRVRDEGVLELREGVEQILVVTGSPKGPARLWTSGHPMTSTTPHAQRYMRAMAHLPLLLRPDPARVLVICVGAGNTVHAATLHPGVQVDAVDLSADVLAINHHFAHSHQGVLHHDRVRAFVNDGRHHLLLQPEGHYDLVTLEPPPLAVAGVSSLYSRDFYTLAASRLTDRGIVAQWLPAYQVPEGTVRSLVRSFVDVFPHAVLLVGSGRELILLGSRAPLPLEPRQVARRLRERPDVALDLARIGLGSVRELASTFAADRDTLLAATAEAVPVTDDRPRLEAAQASHLITTRLPADLFAPGRVGRWCPSCTDDEGLAEVLEVTAAVMRSDAFLGYSSIVPDRTSVVEAPDVDADTLAAIASSATLTRAVAAPEALALRAVELWDAGAREAAWRHLDAARAQAPGVPVLEQTAAAWAARAAEADGTSAGAAP